MLKQEQTLSSTGFDRGEVWQGFRQFDEAKNAQSFNYGLNKRETSRKQARLFNFSVRVCDRILCHYIYIDGEVTDRGGCLGGGGIE